MSKLKRDNKGFGGVELVMAIVIVILLCVVGWYVYRDHNKTSPTYTTTKNITVPTATWNTFNDATISFKYPNSVIVTKIDCPQASQTCISAKSSADKGNGLIFYEQASTATAQAFATQPDSLSGVGIITSNNKSINGFDTFTTETTSRGLSGTFTSWSTFISNNKEVAFSNYPTSSISANIYSQIVVTLKLVN